MIRAMMLATLVVAAGAQQPQRDASPATPIRIGTASVSGIVTLGDDVQTVVRLAVVTMLASDGLEAQSTVSDDSGRFTIRRLPAGRYTLRAQKPAHLSMAYGARRPGRPGTALVVADGQSIRDLRLLLPRGAVLAGRLTMPNGEPLANTQVQAIPSRLMTAGGVAAATSREFQTDDRGEFRIYGLPPDSYLVAAMTFGFGETQRRSDQEFDAIVRTLQQRTPAPAGQAVARPEPLPKDAMIGYAPTYFPGTPIVTDATPIPVQAGDVRDGLGFAVSMVRIAAISGRVLTAAGDPAPAVLLSAELVGPPVSDPFQFARTIRPNAKGEFSFTGLGPGRYRVRAHARSTQSDWAVADVNVSGSDIAGLTLTLQPALTFSGAVSAESGSPVPTSWYGAAVVLQPRTGNAGLVLNGVSSNVVNRQATVGEDGRFTVIGLVPHDYEVRVTLPASVTGGGWTLASIRHKGRDLRDAPLTFADGSIDGVDVVLTNAVTELAGQFTSPAGTPATDYFLVAFPEDKTLWHPASPRIRVMRPAADGAFSTRDLPAGVYRLAALTDVEDDELKRREFLESLYDTPVRVTVEAGKRTVQDVRIK